MAAARAHEGAHKYKRIKVKGKQSVTRYAWRCVRDGCTHYLREEFMIGQTSVCWRCGREFVIDSRTLLLKPHCRSCTKRRNVIEETPIHNVEESPI